MYSVHKHPRTRRHAGWASPLRSRSLARRGWRSRCWCWSGRVSCRGGGHLLADDDLLACLETQTRERQLWDKGQRLWRVPRSDWVNRSIEHVRGAITVKSSLSCCDGEISDNANSCCWRSWTVSASRSSWRVAMPFGWRTRTGAIFTLHAHDRR